MAEGKSFSGRERNTFFLNLGNGSFADASGISGFDYLDDGRAIAITDWDHDGALDFWAYNRSSPRLRLMRNRTTSSDAGGNWLGLKLRGVTSNLDAIGTRVEIALPAGPLVRTVRAGEGFLSQSSTRLHFGLGDHSAPLTLSIYWPGDRNPEVVTDVPCNQIIEIHQGSGVARSWERPSDSVLSARAQQSLPVTENARIVLAGRPPMPRIPGISPAHEGDGPMLLSVWASWCKPCIEELSALQRRRAELNDAGLRVVLVNADEQAPDREAKVAALLKKRLVPFENRLATERSLRILDATQRSLTQRQRALPLPASFLIDSRGRLAIIYKGKVNVTTLLEDAAALGDDPAAWRSAAVPFPAGMVHPSPISEPTTYCHEVSRSR